MAAIRCRVVEDRVSAYPRPITFAKGTPLRVGRKDDGPEGWEDWYFCSTPGQEDGWVPGQAFEIVRGNEAIAREDYTSKELTVRRGETVVASRTLNGWAWCARPGDAEAGWVPLANLEQARE